MFSAIVRAAEKQLMQGRLERESKRRTMQRQKMRCVSCVCAAAGSFLGDLRGKGNYVGAFGPKGSPRVICLGLPKFFVWLVRRPLSSAHAAIQPNHTDSPTNCLQFDLPSSVTSVRALSKGSGGQIFGTYRPISDLPQ